MESATKGEVSEVAERVVAPKTSKGRGHFLVDVVLRVLLIVVSVASVVVMVTSEQTKRVPVTSPVIGKVVVLVDAKFTHSPEFIYLVVAMSITVLDRIISAIASLLTSCKPACSSATLLLTSTCWGLGIVASATGAAGGVAYVGLKRKRSCEMG